MHTCLRLYICIHKRWAVRPLSLAGCAAAAGFHARGELGGRSCTPSPRGYSRGTRRTRWVITGGIQRVLTHRGGVVGGCEHRAPGRSCTLPSRVLDGYSQGTRWALTGFSKGTHRGLNRAPGRSCTPRWWRRTAPTSTRRTSTSGGSTREWTSTRTHACTNKPRNKQTNKQTAQKASERRERNETQRNDYWTKRERRREQTHKQTKSQRSEASKHAGTNKQTNRQTDKQASDLRRPSLDFGLCCFVRFKHLRSSVSGTNGYII